MSESTGTPSNPSERPYDPSKDADADPEELTSREPAEQPDQAEGEDDASEYGGA
jgi:hypothetical protein